ncbi:hypothetical protein JL722_12472 [Aureococcus anophagefferens]|nr:hypothetical protein JL722_12472 [Aureococcus anophagefferens]
MALAIPVSVRQLGLDVIATHDTAKYEIVGTDMQMLRIHLDPGEKGLIRQVIKGDGMAFMGAMGVITTKTLAAGEALQSYSHGKFKQFAEIWALQNGGGAGNVMSQGGAFSGAPSAADDTPHRSAALSPDDVAAAASRRRRGRGGRGAMDAGRLVSPRRTSIRSESTALDGVRLFVVVRRRFTHDHASSA